MKSDANYVKNEEANGVKKMDEVNDGKKKDDANNVEKKDEANDGKKKDESNDVEKKHAIDENDEAKDMEKTGEVNDIKKDEANHEEKTAEANGFEAKRNNISSEGGPGTSKDSTHAKDDGQDSFCLSDILKETNKVLSDDFTSDDNVPIARFKIPQGVKRNLSEVYTSSDEVPLAKCQVKKKVVPKKKCKTSKTSNTQKEVSQESQKHTSEKDDQMIEELYESDIEGEFLEHVSSDSSGDESDDEDDGSRKTLKWTRSIRTIKIKPFTGPNPGPTLSLSSDASPLHYFYQLFPEGIFKLMAKSTNKYVPIYEQAKKKTNPKFNVGDFYADEDDIKAYLGIRMIMAINPLPSISDYWSTDPALRNSYIADTMSRNSFNDIQRYFHINDPTKDPTRITSKKKAKELLKENPLYKVQPLIEAIRENSSAKYHLHRDISVDEAMIKFTGQHWCVVGAPNKPAKRGFKIFCLCDGSTGYLKDFQLYQRRKKEIGLTQRVCENLVEDIHTRNHILYIDKFYTSIDLAKSLLEKGMYICGSFNAGRKNFPTDLKPNKKVSKKKDPVRSLQRGDSLARQSTCGTMNAVAWMDSAVVLNLSTCFDVRKGEVQRNIRQEEGEWKKRTLQCPEPIQEFNKYMGGVDQHDHLRSSYSLQRMSSKWWLYFAWFGIDIALINGYILCTEDGKKITHKNFQMQVRFQIFSN